ncbi:DNA-binding response regulator, NarL/FixJ family, contains REC and HTH domains [Aquimarina amphilecti]|uniref:DNA-binding response regulator, NarL/FixJ family, contains REC and HTH domains n=1 Tax=Aquimarina amphilecti TaxID=1038014 RepID=A0A1H7T1Y3_AQUAM|nr:response regulator transcription factor [Aquimarina amphilecti]SEL78535.1 DNA-binding response regulator, NarL/FixJ family, contains REC and HTH domains [Aquimarina amphilecti]
MKEYSVVVAYDDPLKRLGIKAMLEAPKDMKFNLYEDISNLENLRKVIVDSQPDFIVIDATLNSNDSGIELAKYTKLHASRTKIVIMAFTLEKWLIKELKDLEVKWILYKADTVENLTKCAGRAIQNKPYISKIFRESWWKEKSNPIPKVSDKSYQQLSKTEIKILNQVALGKTNREIALDLFKSEKTIKNHRQNICKKLQIAGSNALFKYTMKLKDVYH